MLKQEKKEKERIIKLAKENIRLIKKYEKLLDENDKSLHQLNEKMSKLIVDKNGKHINIGDFIKYKKSIFKVVYLGYDYNRNLQTIYYFKTRRNLLGKIKSIKRIGYLDALPNEITKI